MILKVMCDYAAHGLWLDGRAIDYEYLIKKNIIKENYGLKEQLKIWQQIFEKMNLWSVAADELKENIDSIELVIFNQIGEAIAQLVADLVYLNNNSDKYKVVYFDEFTHLKMLVDEGHRYG
jgi:hypothetical protein